MQPQDQQKISLLLQQYFNLKNEVQSNWLLCLSVLIVGSILYYGICNKNINP